MAEPPVLSTRDMLHFSDGSLAYAGHYLHEGRQTVHTHSFVEMAVVTGGTGAHLCLSGRQELKAGDVLLLRPGAWHGYEDCCGLDLFNCCFSTELLQRELAWTREDPLIGYLLWTGPYADQRRGVLSTHLEPAALAECIAHLDGLDRLALLSVNLYRGDIVGRLALALSCVARAAAQSGDPVSRTHPAVADAMRMMEALPAHQWTLTELAAGLHLAPGYLIRLFKSATGLPPMAFLSRHRVELAAARLLHTDEPVSRIGESVGWPDPNYFARRFRAHYGLSASAYRARFTHNAVRLRTWSPGVAKAPPSVSDDDA